MVKEERRISTEDDPESLTYERFNATAYVASPYRNPVIGWPGDLEELRLEDIKDWYRLWYAPNNATLVVAGDVDPEQVFALAEKHFGPSHQTEASIGAQNEVATRPRRGEKHIKVKAPAQGTLSAHGLQVPPPSVTPEEDWEPYALEMLSSVLGGEVPAPSTDRELVRGSHVAASAGDQL